jgi:hypothetical protein
MLGVLSCIQKGLFKQRNQIAHWMHVILFFINPFFRNKCDEVTEILFDCKLCDIPRRVLVLNVRSIQLFLSVTLIHEIPHAMFLVLKFFNKDLSNVKFEPYFEN